MAQLSVNAIDPPWLEDACACAFDAFKRDAPDLYPGPGDWVHNVVRAVLAFAASRSREIADAEVEAAAVAAHLEFHKINYGDEIGTADSVARQTWPSVKVRRMRETRAALEAAEKARR